MMQHPFRYLIELMFYIEDHDFLFKIISIPSSSLYILIIPLFISVSNNDEVFRNGGNGIFEAGLIINVPFKVEISTFEGGKIAILEPNLESKLSF
jgi:hypothetical protein